MEYSKLMFRRRTRLYQEIAPDEIFLDSSNLPSHESSQFEGRIEKPVSRGSIFGVGAVFILVAIIFSVRAFDLQVARGADFSAISRDTLPICSNQSREGFGDRWERQ